MSQSARLHIEKAHGVKLTPEQAARFDQHVADSHERVAQRAARHNVICEDAEPAVVIPSYSEVENREARIVLNLFLIPMCVMACGLLVWVGSVQLARVLAQQQHHQAERR